MGDEFSWNINDLGVAGVDLANEPTAIWRLRLDTGASVRLDWFVLQGQLEVGGGEAFQSPLGIDSFDTLAPFEYTLNAGININDTFIVRLGRSHYERTEAEGLLNRNGFQASANAANVLAPLDWLGGELQFQTGQGNSSLKSLILNAAYYYGADSSHFGLVEGLVSLAFTDSEEPPTLTLAGFGTLRPETPGSEFGLNRNGTLYGQGGVAVFEYGLFSATTGVTHRSGIFEAPLNPTAKEETFMAMMGLSLEPGDFLFRGAYTFIANNFSSDIDLEPPQGLSESHWELSAGYRPLEWMLVSLGYRGIRGDKGDANQLFIGIQSSLGGSIPFQLTSQKEARASR